MKIPRDLSGRDLAKALSLFGYAVTRQSGSHVRLTTLEMGEHHVTVPQHDALRMGTLSAILAEVSSRLGITKERLVERLFAR